MDNLADLGVVVHELQHASDDAAVDRPTSKSRLEVESAAYERQSRFLMLELEKLTGDVRTKAEADVGSRIGQTHVYFMIAVALEATDDDQFDDRSRIVAGVNRNKDPGTELEPAELRRALNDTKEGNRAKARDGIVDDIKRHNRPPKAIFRGFKGESALDVTPAPAATLQRDPKDSKPSSFEQEISIDQIAYNADRVNVSSGITLELLTAAQKLVSKGPIKRVEDLQPLRKIALADQTISDAERLFLAGLLDAENAKRVAAVDLKSTTGPSLKLRFVLDDETEKRIHAVAQLGRPTAGKGTPEAQIQALASGREKERKGDPPVRKGPQGQSGRRADRDADGGLRLHRRGHGRGRRRVCRRGCRRSPAGRRSEGRTDQGRRDAAHANRGGSLHPDSQRRGREGRHDVFQVDV